MTDEVRVIAVTGKGGVGKTIFTYLLSQHLINLGIHPLLIDADPTMSHLSRLFNQFPENSLETIRKRVIKAAIQRNEDENQKIAAQIDEIVEESIIFTEKYSLLVMGQPESKGCFCATNSLLRSVIASITQDYEIILIDCEAGLEQIHRQVMGNLDYLVVVSDFSLRSIETAAQIVQSADSLINFKEIGIVINKAMGEIEENFQKRIDNLEIPILGVIPFDQDLMKIEQRGESPSNLSKDCLSNLEVKKIVGKLLYR